MSRQSQKTLDKRPDEHESYPTASPEQIARDKVAHTRARMASWNSNQFPTGRHPDAKEKPSGQLGEPTARRRKKSTEGFHVENLASDIAVTARKDNGGPKVSRAVEKTPFTLPAQRTRVSEEEVERAIRLKRQPDVMAKLTAIDRMLEDHEFHALAWYVQNHFKRQAGRPSRMRYDDTPRGLIESGDDDAETRRILNSAAMEYVDARLPEAGLEFLSTLTHMMFPSMFEGKPPTKVEVGRAILKLEGRDRAEGAFDGYTRCISQALADLRADWAIEYKRQEDAKLLRKSEERKKQAQKLFDEVTR
jgi:hypothetical protein